MASAANDDPGSGATPESEARSPLRLVLAATSGHRREIAVVAVVAFVGGFTEAAVLVIIARLAFALASGNSHIEASLGPLGDISVTVPQLVAVAAGLVLLRVALQLVQARAMSATFAAVTRGTRLRLVTHYLRASWSLQSAQRDGRLQELVSGYAGQISGTVMSFTQSIVAVFSLGAFLITAVFVNAIAAAVVVGVGVATALLLRPIRAAVRRRSWRAAKANLSFATSVTELASSLLEVRVFNVEQDALERTTRSIDESARLAQRNQFLQLVSPALFQGMALLLIVGAVAVVYASGATRLASFGGIVLIMIRSLSYGQQLQTNYQALHAAAPYFETIADEEVSYRASEQRRDGLPVDHIGVVACDHVSYEYERGRPVLRDVSFRLERGEVVGIIGPSGSGKSTLVQLLLRLRDPTAGKVTADGRDVRELDLDDWYRRVSFVPQDAHLVAGSVADNIRFYRDGIDDEAVERAAKLANLRDDVAAMRNGYDTPVGERGGQLSGGQRQRVAIARALAEEPDLLVLDEPTSALDVKSEALIRETLRDLGGSTTVVVIAHRLSTLDICDRIMVIHEGMLQGFDTPARLEATDPFYREALTLSGLR